MHWNEKQPYVHVEQNHAPQKGTSSISLRNCLRNFVSIRTDTY